MAKRTILVVGGAHSGPTAAARARETDENARIVLIERGPHVSFARSGPAYHLSGEAPAIEALNRERVEYVREVYRVEVFTGRSAVKLESRRKLLQVDGESLPYSSIVWATGIEPVIPAIKEFADARNVFRFRTITDLEGILERLAAGARKVAVIGGGFSGIEAADAFLRRGCEVAIVEKGPRILARFSERAATLVAEALAKSACQIVVNADAKGTYRVGDAVRALRLPGNRVVDADLFVITAGSRPRVDVLAKANAKLRKDGSLAIDANCRTSLAGVYACGPAVSVPHALTGKPFWSARGSIADRTAQVAGANAAGGKERLAGFLDTTIVRALDLVVARTGLTGDDAKAFAGSRLGSVLAYAPHRDPWMSASDVIAVELFFKKDDGRVIGAEIAGRYGVDKRADVLATAIRGGMKIDALAELDLAYAPPWSAARDVINVAGRIATIARARKFEGITPAALAEKKRVVVIDVRGERDFLSATIPGAQSAPLPTLRERVKSLLKQPLVFVDDTGKLGYLAARIARHRGRKDATWLAGGMRAWLAAGKKTAPGAPAKPKK